jgi:hypothetical protein
LAAAGAFTISVCAGVNKVLVATENHRGDLIPVDYVSNGIIVGTALQARKNELLIVHSASSHLNPITWWYYLSQIYKYCKTQPFEFNFAMPGMTLVGPKMFEVRI